MTMHPGPELDELVLEKIFGKTKAQVGFLQNYSSQYNASFEVINKMDELDFLCVSSVRSRDKAYKICFEQYYPAEGEAIQRHCATTESFCLSVCLAALKACGVQT